MINNFTMKKQRKMMYSRAITRTVMMGAQRNIMTMKVMISHKQENKEDGI